MWVLCVQTGFLEERFEDATTFRGGTDGEGDVFVACHCGTQHELEFGGVFIVGDALGAGLLLGLRLRLRLGLGLGLGLRRVEGSLAVGGGGVCRGFLGVVVVAVGDVDGGSGVGASRRASWGLRLGLLRREAVEGG